MLLGSGLLAFACMLAGEWMLRFEIKKMDAQLDQLVTHTGGTLAAALEGQLLRVVGWPQAEGPVRDVETGLAFTAAVVRRRVDRWMVLDVSALTNRAPIGRWREVWFHAEIGDDIPAGLINATLMAPGVQIAGVRLSPRMAEYLSIGLGEAAGEEAVATLAARFPGWRTSWEEERLVLASAEGERRDGDIRIEYRVHTVAQPVTMIGMLRDGLLGPPPPNGFWPILRGEVPVCEMLNRTSAAAADDVRFLARTIGFIVLGCGAMTVWFLSSARAARA